jgi:hypothetical protein
MSFSKTALRVSPNFVLDRAESGLEKLPGLTLADEHAFDPSMPLTCTFFKPGKSNGAPSIFSIHNYTWREACELLLFAHAITGCDMTSALYTKAKIRGLKLIMNHEELSDEFKIFNLKDASKEVIKSAGDLDDVKP